MCKGDVKLKPAILLVAFAFSGCTTSSAIMTGAAREARPASEVKIFLREPQSKYESIALVTAFSNAAASRDGSREKVIEELRRKAGGLGANGIILDTGERDTSPTIGTFIRGGKGSPGMFVAGSPGLNVEMQAEAIFVQQE